jgi:CHAT domain-containing protein/tetratricopeptide (TPR) repeat protein
MRACLFAVVFALFALSLHTCAQAQDAQQPRTASSKTEPDDVAEQLVVQVHGWFTNLAAQGKVPRVFTGISPDARQFIVELDSLTFDHVKRREFIIWLSRKFRIVAYAYATRMIRQADAGEAKEALDIYASSLEKDVAASFSIQRNPDGSITYQRQAYLSEQAKDQRDEIFLGLHRTRDPLSAGSDKEFEQTWSTLESTVYWRKVGTQASNPNDPGGLVTRALQLYAAGDCEASLAAARRAADLLRDQKKQSAEFASALVAQALCHKRLVHVAEAEGLYRQAIDIYEQVLGPNSSDLAITLDNLAALYSEHGRLSEAEQLRLRALKIFKDTLDPGNPHIATTLQNLAVLYQYQGRVPEAQAKFLEALSVAEKAYGQESREVGIICDNVAGLYRSQRDFSKADPFYTRALSIFQKTLGRDHPDTALALQNRAVLLSETGRSEEAERNLKEAIGINERLYGTTHNTIAAALNTLVLQYLQRERWADALEQARRAAAVSLALADRSSVLAPSEGGQRSSSFRRLVHAAYGAGPDNAQLMNEAYIAAQRALDTQAALALSQLAVRHAIGDSALARLLRERQDLAQEVQARDKLLIGAVARAPSERRQADEEHLKLRIKEIGERMAGIDQTLTKQFPQFTELSKAAPVSIADTQALLRSHEALLLYLDLQAVGDVPETGFAWLVTKESAEWSRLPIGSHGLARSVAALRCGLDQQQWSDDGGTTCKALLKTDNSSREWLPFDVNTAFELYRTLFGPFEAKIKGKHLLLVPSGALTGLPASVLVTEKPADAIPAKLEAYRTAAWLGGRQPITILPSPGSLKSLRQFAKASAAAKAYLGIGNPLLDGPDASSAFRAEIARTKQTCHNPAQRLANIVAGGTKLLPQRGGLAPVAEVRALIPLPETADELCGVARDLGVPDGDIWLGARATETEIKRASVSGELATYRIVHFATHGALAGELVSGSEPGLILTPPRQATSEDDGYLSASEIAALKLDADWVILSACNTAAGGAPGTEVFSGMARAFFYAGARSLLVSHWAVDSDTTVKLITKALADLASDKSIGRAEALRRAILVMINNDDLRVAHPANWAPFVVVGEGGTNATPIATSPIISGRTSQPPAKAKPRTIKKVAPTDWRKEVWR